jgi:hypothetical protein
MVVISYLYFVCFFFGGVCCETACCGMGAQGFSNYKPCMQQKVCSFSSLEPYVLFLLDCLPFLVGENALVQSTLITSAVVLSLPALSNDA